MAAHATSTRFSKLPRAAEARAHLKWQKDFDVVSRVDGRQGRVAWFLNGKLNASENCIDRHLENHADRTALIFEPDQPGHASKVMRCSSGAGSCAADLVHGAARPGVSTG